MAGTKRRKVIDVDWVDERIVSQIPAELIEKSEVLAQAIEYWQQQKDVVHSVAASTLEIQDVYDIFDLKKAEARDFTVEEKDMFAIPSELDMMFTKFSSVLGQRHIENEALARCFINLLVFNCVLEERSLIQNSKIRPTSTLPSSMIPTPTTPLQTNPGVPVPSPPGRLEPVAIGLYLETELKQRVLYGGKPVLLSGLADYSLGYRQGGTSSGSLVIVEAKRRYQIGNSYGQLLAYMAMIHAARKKEEKRNAVVFGVATDGFYYHFWRIDNSSSVESSSIYDWSLPSQRQHIYSMFRTIIRAAILSTPTTSPVKGDNFTENFSGASHSKLDFGTTSKWQDAFTTEDDPDVELVEMPPWRGGNS